MADGQTALQHQIGTACSNFILFINLFVKLVTLSVQTGYHKTVNRKTKKWTRANGFL